MNTPTDVIDMLEALREDGHDLVTEDTDKILEIAYEMGFEHEAVWFYEWPDGFDPASDLDAKPTLNIAKFNQAVAELARSFNPSAEVAKNLIVQLLASDENFEDAYTDGGEAIVVQFADIRHPNNNNDLYLHVIAALLHGYYQSPNKHHVVYGESNTIVVSLMA